jgi:DNA-directed RNA polymerase subunit E'/Rpb7
MTMEQIAVFEEKIALSPGDFRKDVVAFDPLLLEKLRQKLEGKCSRHGYVVPGSLELLSRSLGVAEKGRFTGDFLFYLKAQGKVYNPPNGTQVEGEVLRKNKMGLYVVIEDAVRIMIPRDLHIGNEDFDSIEIGERIIIEIKESRFQVNDTHILSIGMYVRRSGATLVQEAAEEEEEEEEEVEEEEEEAAQEALSPASAEEEEERTPEAEEE